MVSKICIELDNHLGINDKDLAEFIIDLAEKNTTFESFKKVLTENGADFPDSFVHSLLRIIHLMKPLKKPGGEGSSSAAINTDHLAMKFPGLAMPNQSQKEMKSDDEGEDGNVADDMLAELEALAPSSSKDSKHAKRERDDDRKEDKKKVKDEDRKRDRSKERTRHRSRDRSRSRERKRRSSSRDRKRRSSSRDRKRKRSRSRSRDRKRERSRSRDRGRRGRSRSRERRRERSRSRERNRRDNRSSSREKNQSKKAPMPEDPEPGQIYQGRVANITNFGCFVQLMGLRKKWEGLVHISQLRAEGKVNDVTEVVSRGANVRVKVMSVAGQKVSLSMKEVEQETGRDLNPASHAHLRNDGTSAAADRAAAGSSMLQLEGGTENADDDATRKRVTRISSPERWEIKQMISSGVIDRTEMPDFDEETGLLPKDDDNEADIEIEIVEEEPAFLAGHGRALHDLSPVRIVKNPDGSLAQAAMMQSALAKERREVKMYQREQEMDSVPTNLNKNWIDPMPDGEYFVVSLKLKSEVDFFLSFFHKQRTVGRWQQTYVALEWHHKKCPSGRRRSSVAKSHRLARKQT